MAETAVEMAETAVDPGSLIVVSKTKFNFDRHLISNIKNFRPLGGAMSTNNAEIRIYVACLAAYNNGRLHGSWIDADQDADKILEAIKAVLEKSPERGAEEWAIHDYEGFQDINIGEYESIERVSALAQAIAKHGSQFTLWYSQMDGQNIACEEWEDAMNESFMGEWDNSESFVEDMLDEDGTLATIPEHLRNYFDFQAYARDLETSGSHVFIRDGGKTYVYMSR
jgi:antirestriction protein